ncbi:hypothetical protein G7K_1030-t1 [Saitoella complicata NRRL Y-17804]|uniref:Uncharacterized protein n=1 Tax=Saitoella complicata (strain BCRC 22490 / CBS 7301 / JCM 7358 / NBRC 10748 / NRRL Y-17804) TaxID=698492 RepID=A0A0E9NA99_SAICN|nr:hypothetical protein G7K_1030-t1 [Saitoella complicata NRRL Y-17804]
MSIVFSFFTGAIAGGAAMQRECTDVFKGPKMDGVVRWENRCLLFHIKGKSWVYCCCSASCHDTDEHG